MGARLPYPRPLRLEQFHESFCGAELAITAHIEVVVPVGMAGFRGVGGGQLHLAVGGSAIVTMLEETHTLEVCAMRTFEFVTLSLSLV